MLCSAHNITVKDLGREVQREMNASIASVPSMIERLDLNSKHTGVSVPLSSSPRGTSRLSYKGKDMKECEITESPNEIVEKNVCGMSSVESSCVKSIIPGQSEASLVQVGRAVRLGTKGLAITFVSSASDYDVLNHVSDDIIVDMWSDLNED